MTYKTDKELNEEIYKEFVNEDDGLLNIGKYDHDRLRDFISQQRKEDLKVIIGMLKKLKWTMEGGQLLEEMAVNQHNLELQEQIDRLTSLSNNT